MMPTIKQALLQATQQLTQNTDNSSPRLDAELLLADLLQKDRSYLIAWSEQILTLAQQQSYDKRIQQRLNGMPIAYLIGYRDFWTLRLSVSEQTLIPRPETELLVETALSKIPVDHPSRILDLGTGTGAIALAIASERPHANITATDVSEEALNIARGNAATHALHVTFLQSNWFHQIDEQFDLIVSNPPYIASQDQHLQQGDVRFEPLSALSAGIDGLDDIRLLIEQSPRYLKENGWLMMEHGYDQGKIVPDLLNQKGFTQVACLKDLENRARLSIGQIG